MPANHLHKVMMSGQNSQQDMIRNVIMEISIILFAIKCMGLYLQGGIK